MPSTIHDTALELGYIKCAARYWASFRRLAKSAQKHTIRKIHDGGLAGRVRRNRRVLHAFTTAGDAASRGRTQLSLQGTIVRDVTLPERAAAICAGFGVHGFNGLMITPDYGSYANITLLLVHAAPPPDVRGPEFDLSPGCGNCGECITACPTGAISDNGVNTLICLRNYISKPETMPEEDYPKMSRRIQGCDTCQRACPYNAALEQEHPPADMVDCMKLERLLTEPDISRMSKYIFHWYAKENRIKAQAALAAANMGRKDLLPLVQALIGSEDKMLDKMARWAAERLNDK